MIGVTMSGLDRAMACGASVLLPQTREIDETEFKEWGTVVHDYLRDVPALGIEAALDRAPWKHRMALESLELQNLPLDPEAYAQEVAVAYDWAEGTAREVSVRGSDSRDYGAGPTEIAGRADVVGLLADTVIVDDYKTGYRYLGRAEESWQLKGYALGFARLHGMRRARVRFIRIPEDGVPWFISGELGWKALREAADALARRGEQLADLRARGVREGHPELDAHVKPGPWCTYCPAFGRCPEKAAALVKLAAANIARTGGVMVEPVLTEETVSAAYDELKQAQAALDYQMDAIKRYAKGSPFTTREGLRAGYIGVPVETFEHVRGGAALAERYGAELATDAIETTPRLTKASLKRALARWVERQRQKKVKGLRITHLIEEAVDAIRKAGASRVVHPKRFREHVPGIATEEEPDASAESEAA